jgi:hypothetical protein
MTEEFDAKNLSFDGRCLQAVGVDISRFLPGIYWRTFFGRSIAERIGREQLLSAPAHEARAVGDGVLLALDGRGRAWSS